MPISQNRFNLRGGRLNAAVWGLSCFCIMIFGYNQAVAGGVLTTKSFQNQFPQMDTLNTTGAQQHYNANIQGTVIALYTLCGTFGALACTFLGDVWGRRWTIFAAVTTELVGVILMGTSFQFAQFIISRIVLGLGTGGIIATTSVWQSELSQPHSRGQHVSGFGIFCGSGIALALWIAFGTHYVDNSFSWRFPFLIQALLSVVVMTFIFTLPESPRWLVKMKRIPEAEEVFAMIYDVSTDSETVQLEIRDVQYSLELANTVNLRDMFKMGPQRTFHRVVLAAVIQIYLQLTGVNVITYYASTIFEQDLKFTNTIADILAASSQFAIILGACVCSLTVDRYGRRALMMGSSAGMAVCQAILTGLLSTQNNPAALKAGVAFIFLYYFVYVLGFLGIPFLYASEIAPIHLRAAVCGVSTAVSWLFNFLVAEITPIAFTTIAYRYFIVYAAVNASCIPVVYFFYPETAGRSLEEIDEIFNKSSNIFEPVRVAKTLPRKHLSEFLVEEGKVGPHAQQVEDVDGGRDVETSAAGGDSDRSKAE